MDTVRIGIIGVGGMGSNHARTFENGDIERGKLTAVCDIEPRQIDKFGDHLKKFTDSRELIRSGEVDAVVVATPHYGHTTIGIDALEQGLHVLVEKPISVHKADAERLINAYEKRPKPEQVFAAMFNQRTDPRYKKVRDLIVRGELGEISRINWIITDWFRTQAYYDGGGWRATWEGEGGGVLLNQCPHQLDLMYWLFGKPTKVRAFCGIGRRHHIEVEDEVTAYMEYDNGATGVFITSTGEAPGTNRLEICGERGKLIVEGKEITFVRNEIPTAEFCRTSQQAFARPEVWTIGVPVNGVAGQHTEVLQNYVNAILDGKELIAPATDGIHSVEIANAMLFSSFRETAIELPIDGAAYESHLRSLIDNSTFRKKTVDTAGKDVDMSASFNT